MVIHFLLNVEYTSVQNTGGSTSSVSSIKQMLRQSAERVSESMLTRLLVIWWELGKFLSCPVRRWNNHTRTSRCVTFVQFYFLLFPFAFFDRVYVFVCSCLGWSRRFVLW